GLTMPVATVHYPDGTEWLVTHCEIVLTANAVAQLSAEEIGKRVLDLLPRIQRLAPYVNEWDELPGSCSLDDVEAHIFTNDVLSHPDRACACPTPAPPTPAGPDGLYRASFRAGWRGGPAYLRPCGRSGPRDPWGAGSRCQLLRHCSRLCRQS